ncbi:nucleoid-associated protein [Pseudomonas fluorescens]|nr:nucleoid-associated protein [Pseudomonas fluorescens]
MLHYAGAELAESEVREGLMHQFNESYNAKQGKAWGLFHPESGAYPFSGWLTKYLAGGKDFIEFSNSAVEHLTKLMEESNLSVGGHALFCHYQQGLAQSLVIALLQETGAVTVTEGLALAPVMRLDLDHIHLAARIKLSEWKGNPKSRQYISFIKGKSGRKANDYFRDFIGCQEGVAGPGETRTLLKAFSDFVESEDLPENSAREKTQTLVSYSIAQSKLGEPVSLEELSELIDEDRPKAFFDHIRNKDYGLSQEIPADKHTLNQFRRFTGRTEGLSISFEAHLLGSKVDFDQSGGTLMLRGLPTQLVDQLNRAGA